MTKLRRIVGLLSILSVLGFLGGCSSSEDSTDTGFQSAEVGQEGGNGNANEEVGAAAEIQAAMAKLSSDDRALAQSQKVCPVSEEPLGTMGTPIKLDFDGRFVFICCEGCQDTIKSDFDTYLAKLDASEG